MDDPGILTRLDQHSERRRRPPATVRCGRGAALSAVAAQIRGGGRWGGRWPSVRSGRLGRTAGAPVDRQGWKRQLSRCRSRDAGAGRLLARIVSPKAQSRRPAPGAQWRKAPGNAAIGSALRLGIRAPAPPGPASTGASGGWRSQAGWVRRGGHVIGDGLVFVHAQMAGVGADKSFVEDAAGKLIEVVFFQGAQETGPDLGGHSDVVQRDLALFPLPLQPCHQRIPPGVSRRLS